MSSKPSDVPTIVSELSLENTLKYYTVNACCDNCYEHNTTYVLKGIRKRGLVIKCKKCECEVAL